MEQMGNRGGHLKDISVASRAKIVWIILIIKKPDGLQN